MALFQRNSASPTGRPQPTAGRNLLLIETSFDLLEGQFRRAETTRRSLLAVSLATISALLGLLLWGVNAAAGTSQAETTLNQTRSELSSVRAQLAELDQAGGYQTSELASHNAARIPIYNAAVLGEVDYARLLGVLARAAGNNVDATSIAVNRSTDDSLASLLPTVTVSITAPDFSTIVAFVERLRSSPAIASVSDPEPGSWGGDNTQRTAVIVATLSEALFTERGKGLELLEVSGMPLPPAAAPANDAGGTSTPSPDTTEDPQR